MRDGRGKREESGKTRREDGMDRIIDGWAGPTRSSQAPRSLSCLGTLLDYVFPLGRRGKKGGGGREQEAWPGRVCACACIAVY